MIDEILYRFTEKTSNVLDDKIKEACLAWGVDVNNHHELKARCELRIEEDDPLKELRIDGYLVMLFGDWEMEPQDFNKELTIRASFKCSEIMKPSDYYL